MSSQFDTDDITLDLVNVDRKEIAEVETVNGFSTPWRAMVISNDYLQLRGSGTSVTEKKGNSLLSSFKNICDEIVSGYAEGNRIRYIEDDTSEDGFVKISKTEELFLK